MTLDGDRGFTGVDLRRDPGELEAGLCADAQNCRFRRGRAEPRHGVRLLAWGAPGTVGQDPALILPYGDVAGAGVFNDPVGGGLWLIVATAGGVYRTQPGATGSLMPLPASLTIPERVEAIQTFSGMVMGRGAGLDPIWFDELDAGWKALPAPPSASYALPPFSHGLYAGNRLLVVNLRATDPALAEEAQVVKDTVFASDYGTTADCLSGDRIYNNFRINQGSRDSLVGLHLFGETTVVCFKEASVSAVFNVTGNNAAVSANAVLRTVTSEYGLRAPRAVAQVGAELWFLAHRHGVMALVQTATNQLQCKPEPVSTAIDPLIARINWEHADHACMATWDNKVYLAVPLDDATTNDTVLVFDRVTNQWCGRDTLNGLTIFSWLKMPYAGVERLMFISDTGYVCLYEDGLLDQVPGEAGAWSGASVDAWVKTRGYGGREAGRKQFGKAMLNLATWWPTYSLTAHVEGVGEERALITSRSRSNVAYDRPAGRADWDDTNVDDDFHDAYRQDYAMIVGADGLAVGPSGLTGDLHQEQEVGANVFRTGRHCQLKLTVERGRAELVNASVEILTVDGKQPATV